jgi:hypothetical protein
MTKLPKKFCDRVQSRLKHFQTIAASHRTRDVSEADTVTLVKDILADVFGYDKYSELTSEHQIRGTFCDLAIQIDGKIRFLIEVKGAGSTLTDAHLRQAVNYGAHQGIEWIILTNAIEWRFYKVTFSQPIEYDEITRLCLTDLNARSEDDLQKLFLLAREGLPVDAITAFHQLQQVVNQYTIAQILVADPVVALVRKEMRRLFPDLKIDPETVRELMTASVLKRDVVDGDKANEARQRIKKAGQKLERAAKKAAVAAAA